MRGFAGWILISVAMFSVSGYASENCVPGSWTVREGRRSGTETNFPMIHVCNEERPGGPRTYSSAIDRQYLIDFLREYGRDERVNVPISQLMGGATIAEIVRYLESDQASSYPSFQLFSTTDENREFLGQLARVHNEVKAVGSWGSLAPYVPPPVQPTPEILTQLREMGQHNSERVNAARELCSVGDDVEEEFRVLGLRWGEGEQNQAAILPLRFEFNEGSTTRGRLTFFKESHDGARVLVNTRQFYVEDGKLFVVDSQGDFEVTTAPGTMENLVRHNNGEGSEQTSDTCYVSRQIPSEVTSPGAGTSPVDEEGSETAE